MLKLFEVGQAVLLCGDIPATITAITIRGPEGNRMVQYEVAWWSGSDRKEAWISPSEFTPIEPKIPMLKVGF